LAIAAIVPLASAQSDMTINGKAMDSDVVNLYIQSRSKKPLSQITEQERAQLIDELADVYALATSGLAQDLEKDPAVAAQLELQRMGILAQAVASELAKNIEVSDEEIRASYQEQIKLAPSQQLKARHILVQTQSEAIEIIAALADGADFNELAKERSTDSSGANGGDLGWFTPDQMVKPFSDAVVALDDGQYTTEPVQSQFGWHVILREEARAATPPPLESARENIKARLQGEKLRAKIDEMKTAAINQ